MGKLSRQLLSAWRLNYTSLRQYSLPAVVPSQQAPTEIPVEVAALVRRRTLGTVEVPAAVATAVETAAQSGSRSTKLQRKQTLQLVESLRQLSRTPGKGGSSMSLISANAGKQQQRKRRAVSSKQSLRDLKHGAAFSLGSEKTDAASASEPSNMEELLDVSDDEDTDGIGRIQSHFGARQLPERESTANSGPDYDDIQVAAYASSRMPACYSVLYRVFDELHLHLPDFTPESMLDFGSGPGTAIWAAREVWETHPQRVTAIEPSNAMVKLANKLWHAQQTQQQMKRVALRAEQQIEHMQQPSRLQHAGINDCSIAWHKQLHPSMLPSNKTRSQQTRRQMHDLVVASYVLTEMQSDAERQQAVDMLWRQTKDVLVLVEPGTPSGSAYVRQARSQILNPLSSKLAAKRQVSVSEPARAVPAQPQAHVVAPCPHDGRCPMEGTKSWCHFAQRFQRSDLQRRHKVLPGGHGARTYQDERFSYVILRRGPRPSRGALPEVSITRQRQIDPPDAVQQAIDAGLIPRTPQQVPVDQAATNLAGELDTDSEDEQASVDMWAGLNLPDLDNETRQAILTSIKDSAASDEDEEDQELLQLLTHPNPTDADAAEQLNQVADMPSVSGVSALQSEGKNMAGKVAEAGIQTPELKTGTNQLSQTHSTRTTSADLQTAQVAAHTTSESETDMHQQPHQSTAHAELDDDDRDGYRQWDQDYWQSRDPQAVGNAVAAAQTWSRIIRTPRKRGKHIIVDVCSAQQEEDSNSGVDTSEGHLTRQVIATADKRTWLGPAGYRLVRKSRWGDLWPKFYQDYALTQKTG